MKLLLLLSLLVFALACHTIETDQPRDNAPQQLTAVAEKTPPTADQIGNAPELESEAQLSQPLTVIDINAPVPPNAYPNAKLTPGDIFKVTAKDICVSGYSAKVRNVPQAVKDRVYKNYGNTKHKPGEFEVDHLISLELGGSNSIKNLWTESYLAPNWNAHSKDDAENRLHALVCSGKMTLADAQNQIKTDWIATYKKIFK